MNIELNIIASGIESWAPITSGEIILDAFTDKYKKRFTPTPIENENAIRGNKYFFLGISILQKGNRQTNTMPILIAPNKTGGMDALIPNFAVG